MTAEEGNPEPVESRASAKKPADEKTDKEKADEVVLKALKELIQKLQKKIIDDCFEKFGINANDVVRKSTLSTSTSGRIALGENVVTTSSVMFLEGLFETIGRQFNINGLIDSMKTVSGIEENLYMIRATSEEASRHPEWINLFNLIISYSTLVQMLEEAKEAKAVKAEKKLKQMRNKWRRNMKK